MTVLFFAASVRAGPYSTGLGNINPGAIDPAVPGFVGNAVNPAFAGWATSVTSYQPAPGVDGASDGSGFSDSSHALGPVALTDDPFDIVSLGDLDSTQITNGVPPGRITLSFAGGIRNQAGPDFGVFENGFGTDRSVFADLAYVQVSSDGTHFAQFPSISLTPAAVGPYGTIDPTNVYNLAGKHVNSYGNSFATPFDLNDLTSDPLIKSGLVNLRAIQYVRLIDIPGSGAFTDSQGHPIYDAWETFGSGGFDLDAIGVLNTWLPGDANFDGLVNAQDLGILAAHWQQPGTFGQGDFDHNGIVDINDLYLLASDWTGSGASFSTALSQSVLPEPQIAVGLFLMVMAARRRRF